MQYLPTEYECVTADTQRISCTIAAWIAGLDSQLPSAMLVKHRDLNRASSGSHAVNP